MNLTKKICIALSVVFSIMIIICGVYLIILIKEKNSEPKSPPDLTGNWVQVNSNSGETYHIATIQNETIEIYWYNEETQTKSLYWSGNFIAPTTADEPYSWESQNDTSKTENALLASNGSDKTFTFEDNQLKYSASALGMSEIIKLEKTDDEILAENLDVLLESETQQTTYSFDTPFMFDNLEIVIGSDVKLTEVDNRFSDLNGKETIAIPISVTNKSDELHGLNMFNYKVYGSQGLELEMVGSYFDDNIDYVGDMRPGATANGYIYALYDGDGDYYIYFDNYVEQVEVKLPLSK